jgi:uncharacterized protein YcfL
MKKLFCILLLIVGISLCGCADKRVFLNDNVDGDLDVSEVKMQRNHAGFLEVHIRGDNDAGKYFKPEYRIVWFDESGFPLDSLLSAWTPFPVFDDAEFYITAVAPHPRAVDFKIIIRKQEN